MWRPSFSLLRKVILPSLRESGGLPKIFYSSKGRPPRSTVKITLVSASVGVLIGAGYGGYTHYKINVRKSQLPPGDDYPFLKEVPDYRPQYKVTSETDSSNLQLVLFQYRTCPFCCKVRAYLDARGVSYEVVEVDAVLRQAIKWSQYKKVPILLAKVDGGYQQLLDSTAIVSVLETHLRDQSSRLPEVLKFYPPSRYLSDDGREVTEVANKYFIMSGAPIAEEKRRVEEVEERNWRKWADNVLVHTLSPNVYRSPGEALATFQWFEDVGGWRDAFPRWECTLMVYFGAAAMYLISKRLKARHHLKDDVRESLYDAAQHWTDAIKKKGTTFLGGAEPNLADITVFGVLSSIEGCQAFSDLRQSTDIGKWFDSMKGEIERRKGSVVYVRN